MKNLWQSALSLAINVLFPVAALDAALSTSYWCLSPTLGRAVLMADTTAALLAAISSVAIGRFLRRQRGETSPYVYKNGYSLLSVRSYFGIEATDREAFHRLLKAIRRREVMAPLRPWLLINDAAWSVLIAEFVPIVIIQVVVVLVMRAFSRLMGRTLKMHRTHG